MQKQNGESNHEYTKRTEFYNYLVENNISNPEQNAKIWCNIKFRSCSYSSIKYNFIQKLDKKFSS